MKIVIISPNYNAPTESFINEHFNFLNPHFIIVGGYIPNLNENGKFLHGKLVIFSLKFLSFFFRERTGFFHKSCLFLYLLKIKRSKIIALVEYGTTAHHISPILSFLKIPFYVHFHGYDASVFDFANSEYYSNVIASAKGVFVVSKEMESDLLKIGFKQNQIVYNPYGPREIFGNCKPNYESKVIFALGRFVDKKAPYNVIISFYEVLKMVPNAKLIYAGDGPLLLLCKQLVTALGIEDSVVFEGVIDLNRTISIFNQSQIFVQHSIQAENGDKEGLPLSILEAQLAGLPVVSTTHAGIKDLIKIGVNGYLSPEGDIKSFTQNILTLLNDSQLSKIMGEKGIQEVRKNFNINEYLKKIEKVISQK
jgi:colanic acid/amylovoran biosynthesis glycosyltransferase